MVDTNATKTQTLGGAHRTLTYKTANCQIKCELLQMMWAILTSEVAVRLFHTVFGQRFAIGRLKTNSRVMLWDCSWRTELVAK